MRALRPNSSFKPSPNGGPPGPWRSSAGSGLARMSVDTSNMRRTFASGAFIAICLFGCGDSESGRKVPAPEYSAGKVDPNDPEFKKRVQSRLEEMRKEEAIREEASWFGKTGLPEDTERELPRYLRREFGQLLSQPGSLKAQDLAYVGAFVQGAETVRYWRIHYGTPEPAFAYVVSGPGDRQLTGWGNRAPPQ